jgi:hypothetical protein
MGLLPSTVFRQHGLAESSRLEAGDHRFREYATEWYGVLVGAQRAHLELDPRLRISTVEQHTVASCLVGKEQ